MRVTVDLGFSPGLVLVVLVCVLVPAIGFYLRAKWRRAVARAAEVQRLLVLAAEESARVESEAAAPAVYQYGAVPVAKSSHTCAVCSSPTTKLCSRCKAIHYCSGKCQIVHWRQGHKDVCRPSRNTHQNDDLVSDLGKKVAEQQRHEIHDEKSQIESMKYKKSPKKPPFSDKSLGPEIAFRKGDDQSLESIAEGNVTDSNSELSNNSFSGFSASKSASESSDDSSLCDIISNEHERSDRHIFVDPTLENSDDKSNDNILDSAISLSPKFASLVDAVDGFSTMRKINQVRPGFSKEESKLTSNGSSGLSMEKGPTVKPSTVSSEFWDKTLDSRVVKDDVKSGPLPSHSGNALLKSFGDTVPHTGSSSSESKRVESSGSVGVSSIHNLQSVASNVSNHVVNNPGCNLKSAETSCKPHASAETKLASSAEGHSHNSTKSGNNCIQSDTKSDVVSCPPNSKNGLKSSFLKVADQSKGSSFSKHHPLAVGNDFAGRYNDKGLFPYDLFVKLYNWNRVELQPFGLINCGNSCYANAVLQCLAFTPPLTAYFLQGLHSKSCANTKLCFTCELESLILKSKDVKTSPLSPMTILSQLRSTGIQLGIGNEEDAHEFLRHAIETMQSVCRKESGLDAAGALIEETNLMGLTFGGYLRSKIKCMRCGRKSVRQERMMDLTVEIEGEIATLEEALRRFTSTETLDGENKYYCLRCKSYEKAKKKLTVSEAPNILTIALKRFQSGKFGKLNKPIRFPEILDFAPFMSGTSDNSPIYRLYGVVVHLDNMNDAFSGHYVCYVKNFQNKWFEVDDSVVTPVELERVLTEGAYMLFYARCSPRAPRLIRDKILSSDSKIKVNGKTISLKQRHVSGVMTPDVLPTLETFYSKFHHMKRILEEDSSDSSSLFSSNSDECSCSTDSTHDSTITEDLADFGDPGHGLGFMGRNSDSDMSPSLSSSNLNCRHLPLSHADLYNSVLLDGPGLWPPGPRVEIDGLMYRGKPVDVERRMGGVFHVHPNTNLEHSRSDTSRNSNRTVRE